jgi:capsular exopolysaccharide synthesis family protein
MNNGKVENGGSNAAFPQAEGMLEEGFLQIALCHRQTILLTTVLFLVAAFFYILKATPIYTSASRLYVEQSGPKIIGDFEGIMTRTSNYLYTQAELFKSTPIVGEVANDSQIRGFRTFNEMDNPVAYLKNNLQISVGKKDDIITVAFDSPYPQEAAGVVNAVVDSYIKYHSIRKQTTVSKVVDILQKEKVKRDKELSNKYEEMVQFTRENGVVSFDNKGGNVVFQKLITLSEALTEAQLMTINAQADYEAVKAIADDPAKVKQFAAALPTTGIRVLINDTETQLESELRNAEIELENIGYNVTKDHPAVKALHAKTDHIRSNLAKEMKNFTDAYIEVMRQRWQIAKEKEQTLAASFQIQREAAQDLGVKAAEYTMLQSELGRAERICEILDDRIKELNVTEDTGALNISILEVARPAESPSKPQKAKIMAMAFIIGLIFGSGLALVRDWMDIRLRSADEVSAMLGIPVLGTVMTMTEVQTITERGIKAWLNFKPVVIDLYQRIHTTQAWKHLRKAARKVMPGIYQRVHTAAISSGLAKSQVKTSRARAISPAPDGGKTALGKQGIVVRGQKVYLEPKSVIAEAYRTIRTAVFFGVPKGEAKTILITSPDAGDGKSTLASNLAIAMAQAGQKTLILDADFRKPVQHNIFDFENGRGLSSVLAGTITLDEAIQAGPVEGLDILSCGPEVPNPSEILNSDAFAEILKGELTKRYDRIIVDSPPVGTVADSQILSAGCDITLLVLRAEKSTRKHSQQARDVLQSVGGRLLGAVVNDVPRRHGRYGYYSGYGYYRGSGYYGDREKKKTVDV